MPCHIPLFCWHLSATISAVQIHSLHFRSISFLKYSERGASCAHYGEGEDTFQPIRDLNWPLEMFLSSHRREHELWTLACREVFLVPHVRLMCRQWREGKLEGLFLVGKCRFTHSLPAPHQKKEMELSSHPP